MGQLSYDRVGRRSNTRGGFRINPKRFSVQRLRSRFIFLLKIFHKLGSSYGKALQYIRKGVPGSFRKGGAGIGLKRDTSTSSRTGLLGLGREKRRGYIYVKKNNVEYECNRMRSFGRSNSFYAEAIADCLEFIKRSSVSVDQ